MTALLYTEMSINERAALRASVGGCQLCGALVNIMTGHGRPRLCVDHCHETGRVRGVVCMRCNSALSSLDRGVVPNRPEWWVRAACRYTGADDAVPLRALRRAQEVRRLRQEKRARAERQREQAARDALEPWGEPTGDGAAMRNFVARMRCAQWDIQTETARALGFSDPIEALTAAGIARCPCSRHSPERFESLLRKHEDTASHTIEVSRPEHGRLGAEHERHSSSKERYEDGRPLTNLTSHAPTSWD